MNRRTAIKTASIGVFASLAGCIAESDRENARTDPKSNRSDRDLANASSDDDASHSCEADPSSKDANILLGADSAIAFAADPDREYEYLADEDRVRIEYESGPANEMPFDEWGTRRATAAASERVHDRLDRAGVLEDGVGVSTGVVDLEDLEPADGEPEPDPEEFDRDVPLGVRVVHSTEYSRDGSLLSEPDVEFDRLPPETPRSAEVTMLFDEREYAARLPIACAKASYRED